MLASFQQAFLDLSVDKALKWLYQPKAEAIPSPPARSRVTGERHNGTES